MKQNNAHQGNLPQPQAECLISSAHPERRAVTNEEVAVALTSLGEDATPERVAELQSALATQSVPKIAGPLTVRELVDSCRSKLAKQANCQQREAEGTDLRERVSLTIDLDIHDGAAFRQKAYERAREDGVDEEDAREYLDPELRSLGECATMILDPGTSPVGSSILGSHYESSVVDNADENF